MRTIILLSSMLWSFICTSPISPDFFNTSTLTNSSFSTDISDTHIEDQEHPFAVCIDNIQIELMAVTGTVKLSAMEIEAGLSRDNYTDYRKLHFSFSKDIDNTRLTFDCHNQGRNIIELWVTDEAGNQDYCTAVVIVKDPNHVCGMSLRASSLAGLLPVAQAPNQI